MYNGRAYDYLFDVDLEDGRPPRKLPYNATGTTASPSAAPATGCPDLTLLRFGRGGPDNPYVVAQSFLEREQLSPYLLDRVADFIIRNTQPMQLARAGASGGASEPALGASRASIAALPVRDGAPALSFLLLLSLVVAVVVVVLVGCCCPLRRHRHCHDRHRHRRHHCYCCN